MNNRVSKTHQTSSGILIPQYYTQLPKEFKQEIPGQYPFTRGVHEDMYRNRQWTMRQYAGFSTAAESNIRYKELLAKGAKGLSVAFDLPTQMGYDSNHSLAKGEVGKVGVAIDTLDDMRVLFDGIDLSQISTSMTINATAAILLVMYQCVAEERGIKGDLLNGTIQNDLLKEYMARGTYIYPPGHSMRIITDIFQYCSKELPQWNTISISGYHIREAGSTAAQEMAFTLANGITYVEAAIKAGLQIDEFAPRLSFFFNVHNNFLEEIAKFRALRRMWAKIMKEQFHAKDEKSWKLRFHSQVAGSTLTAQQPLNNVVRVTLQAMAAVLGGTQSLHTNAFDEALQLPTSESAEIALRTQQIIAFESGVTSFVDPWAGSYAIESLTSELEEKANTYLKEIQARGGVVSCIENGYIVGEISNAAYQAQLAIENKTQIIVGVNDFQSKTKNQVPANKIPANVEVDQVQRLLKFKQARDNSLVTQCLLKVKSAAQGSENLLPVIKAAIQSGATLGEVSDSLRQVFGTYQAKQII